MCKRLWQLYDVCVLSIIFYSFRPFHRCNISWSSRSLLLHHENEPCRRTSLTKFEIFEKNLKFSSSDQPFFNDPVTRDIKTGSLHFFQKKLHVAREKSRKLGKVDIFCYIFFSATVLTKNVLFQNNTPSLISKISNLEKFIIFYPLCIHSSSLHAFVLICNHRIFLSVEIFSVDILFKPHFIVKFVLIFFIMIWL